MTIEKKSRRELLKYSAGAVAGIATTSVLADGKKADIPTPSQTEGPFYPTRNRRDKDNDLTYIEGKNSVAQGEVIYLFGKIKDENDEPIERAIIELWQASANGKYDHPGDPNPKPLDPNFQYWGRCATDSNGRYNFKTIKPGHYPATSTWTRPAHIHFKVFRRGYHELTSQLYFEGGLYNDSDRILQSLSAEEQNKVMVKLKAPRIDFDYKTIGDFAVSGGEHVGFLNIHLKTVR